MAEHQQSSSVIEADTAGQVFRRVIDLHDGSGVQVFEAQTAEELVDKLAQAQEHATKKIREQAQEIKDWRSRNERTALTNDAVVKFTSEHQDYLNDGEAGEKNGELMRMKLSELKLPVSAESLEAAYSALKQRGFLSLKGEEAQPQPTTGNALEAERITQRSGVEPTQQRPRRTSGISTHSRTWHVPASSELSEYDLYNMPMEKLRERANKQLSERN